LIAELLIVILGVFIALAIDERQKDTEEAARELEYLTQLITDLQTTEDLMAEQRISNSEMQDAAKNLLAAFEGEEHPAHHQTRKLLADMRFFYYPSPRVATAEALVSTGEFRLIKDKSIRVKVTDYLAYARDDHLAGVINRSERNRELLFQIFVLAQSYGISPGHYKGLDNASSEPNTSAFFADPKAYIYVAGYVENKVILVVNYADALSVETRNLREALEKYVSSM
jgi:hypothetical protein